MPQRDLTRMQRREEEARLVQAARDGDTRAFEQLVRRYAGRVHAIGLSMLRDDARAQDIVQVTFLSAWRKLDTFRLESSFKAWICRIATNACLMHLRSRRRRPEVPLTVGRDEEDGPRERPVVDWSPLADKLLEDRELGERIREAVGRLPEKYRIVVVLADYEHLSMREIAETLDLTVSNVKTRLHRARLAIRADLDAYLAGRC